MGIEIDQTTLTFTPEMTPGQAAFEKWNTPARMPGWEKLAPWQQAKWEAIAQAAIDQYDKEDWEDD